MKIPASVVHTALRLVARPMFGPPVPVGVQRRFNELLFTAAPLPKRTVVEQVVLGGRPGERVSVPGSDVSRTDGQHADGRTVLLLHGGAFLTGSSRTHRVLAAHLAAAAGVPVHVLDYRRAPEHPWPAAEDDAVAAYDALAAAGPVAVVGDSAGGTLALLLARQRTPVALALISPLVDLTRETSRTWTGGDALIRQGWLKQGGEAFVGTADAHALSPLFDDLSGLPPLLVHVSGVECLRPEGELLVERARAAGVDAELVLLPDLWHDVHLVAHLVAEAADASAALGRWVGARLAGAKPG